MESLGQDIRYSLRTLSKTPAFTVIAVVTLALGIGANTAMFTVTNSVLLRPLPFKDSDRVIVISQKMANGGINIFSTPNFLDWKQQGGVVAQMAATTTASFNLSGDETPERISGEKVSSNVFPLLGVQPIIGRSFSAEEDRPAASPVVVLSHALWLARFGSRPDIIGRQIGLNGLNYTIIGVMPAGFHIYRDDELLWAPLQLQSVDTAPSSRTVHWLGAITRLAPNLTLAEAQAEVDAIALRLYRQDPNSDAGYGLVLQPLQKALTGNVRTALLILMGCVGCVLLIACSNVANLLLARGTVRRRELSIRTALGAPRSRIVRQLITESVVLAIFGGVLGLAMAFGATKVLPAINPSSISNLKGVYIDGRVLGYTLLTCIFVTALFGTMPALVASDVDISESLAEGTRGSSKSLGAYRLTLVITETALACILLIGAGLALKSLYMLRSVDLGFNVRNLLTFRIAAPSSLSVEQVPDFYRQALEKIKALPGVESAALSRDLPLSGTDPSMPISIEGSTPVLAPDQIVTRFRAVSPGYFQNLQIPLLRGREFIDSDIRNSVPLAIISESLARLYWPNGDALGKQLKPKFTGAPSYTVIGIAADVHHWGTDVVIEPTAYYSYAQIPSGLVPLVEGYMTIAVRAPGSSTPLLASIRRVIADVDKSVALYDIKTMDAMLSDAGSLRRFDMFLLGTFAGLALALAVIGVYGVMSYSVSQRTREIGIRIALGARGRDVMRLIVGEGIRLAAGGVVLGLTGAGALTRLMSSLLYGVNPNDVFTFATVPIVMLACILLACYLPATRAARLNPITALHTE